MLVTRSILVALGTLLVAAPAFAHSGDVTWGPWKFKWEVRDGAFLSLRYLKYRKSASESYRTIAYKLSMPVVRVRYSGDVCGPYPDKIGWDNLLPMSDCGNQKVCHRTLTAHGYNWYAISILGKLGKYYLYHVYYLSDKGHFQSRLASKGLHCKYDHSHHAYMRFDFDIKGPGDDEVFKHDNTSTNVGYGPGWQRYDSELNTVKNVGLKRYWFIRDKSGNDYGVSLAPSSTDGTADSFSSKDFAVRRYSGAEDTEWTFGAWGHLGYLNGQDVRQKDDVIWYVPHLAHKAAEGEDQWHWIGPVMKVH